MTALQESALAKALAQLQADLPHIGKGETATVRPKDKPAYSYTYADLPSISREILPRLSKLGLVFVAKPALVDGQFVLAYSLLHVSGEREDGQYPLPSSGSPQAIGSAITYGRRYCLCAVTGLAPDDDDDAQQAQQEHDRVSEFVRPQPYVALDAAGRARADLAAQAAYRGWDLAAVSEAFEGRYGRAIGTADAQQIQDFTTILDREGLS